MLTPGELEPVRAAATTAARSSGSCALAIPSGGRVLFPAIAISAYRNTSPLFALNPRAFRRTAPVLHTPPIHPLRDRGSSALIACICRIEIRDCVGRWPLYLPPIMFL